MINIGSGESLALSSINDPRDRELILAAARNNADEVRRLAPWTPTWVKQRVLRLVLNFNHLVAAKALLDSIGSQSIPVHEFSRCSREMQRLILNYDPQPDLTPRVCETSPTFYQRELEL